MARAYVDASRDRIAVLILHQARVMRIYRNEDFPWIAVRIGQSAPSDSLANNSWLPRSISEPEECHPEVWLSDRDCGRAELLTEQVLGQANGYMMVLLRAEITEPADDDA
ncbi:MAG: hypothetical protein ABIO43_05815 [Sphingomicrobium sp.]